MEKISKGFLSYVSRLGGHLGNMTKLPGAIFSPNTWCPTCNLALTVQIGLEMFENNGHLHHWTGKNNHVGVINFISIHILFTWSFSVMFPIK